MEKRSNRSDKYQYLLLEQAFSHDMMESFSNDESIINRLNPFQYNEELLDLDDELKQEFWRIVNTELTDRQKQVIRLYADGYTQMEIAKMLNINQSSITKSIHGNVDYKRGKKNKKVYGGAKKKINKIMDDDDKIIDIFWKMEQLRQKKY